MLMLTETTRGRAPSEPLTVYRLMDDRQLEAAVAELEAARQNTRLDDPALVDELLIMALLRVGDPPAIDRAEQLLDGLLARRAKPDVRRRREALAERVRKHPR